MQINRNNLRTLYTGFQTAFQGAFDGAPRDHLQIALEVPSTTSEEEYGWLGQTTRFREWIGDRVIQNVKQHGYTIKNRTYEDTVGVPREAIEDDRYGVYTPLMAQLGQDAAEHPPELTFGLLAAGFATPCYDGQFFFDTDHVEGDSGSQSNDLSIDISALPAELHGTTTVPSSEELQQVVAQSIQTMLGFKDDQGEPINEGASSFMVMVPVPLWLPASTALMAPVLAHGQTNILQSMSGISLSLAANPRLTWTDKIAVFRTDGAVKPFIRQEEVPVQLGAKAEGSEYEFDNKAHQYGVFASRNVAYGYWQHAVLATMV